jgi:HEAT repeat protein
MQTYRILTAVLVICLVGVGHALAQTAASGDANSSADVSARISELGSPDPTVRAMAACALRYAGEAAAPAIPRLIQLLADDAPTGRIKCHAGTPSKLIAETSSPATEALKALASIGRPAVEPLLAALNNQDVRISARVVKALGRIEDNGSMEALVNATRDANARQVRVQAIRALGRISSPQALEALRSALNDENAEVRREAAWALGRRGDALALDALLIALNDGAWQVRAQAARGLKRIRSERAVEHLTAAMRDQKPEVRLEVVKALGRIGGERAEQALNGALSDESQVVRQHAQRALMRLKGTRARI